MMTTNRKPTGTAASIPAGLAMGALTFCVIVLIGALVTAGMINKSILRWDQTGYAVMAILILSSWVGSTMCAGTVKRQKLVMCISSAGIYFMILLMTTALFFGGQYSGVGETLLLILCGSTLSILLGNSRKAGRKRRKK